MDLNELLTAITTVGFPIVGCIALAWFVNRVFNNICAQNQQREERYINIIQQYGVQLKAISQNLAMLRDDVEELKKG